MAVERTEFKCKKETMFLQENRQRLVKSIADQIYNTIISRPACQKGKSKPRYVLVYLIDYDENIMVACYKIKQFHLNLM